jgi:ribose 5-phosphate isomerase B
MEPRKIAIGGDHAGFESREGARRDLLTPGVKVVDKGTYSLDSVDYPDFGAAVARAVASCGLSDAEVMSRPLSAS